MRWLIRHCDSEEEGNEAIVHDADFEHEVSVSYLLCFVDANRLQVNRGAGWVLPA